MTTMMKLTLSVVIASVAGLVISGADDGEGWLALDAVVPAHQYPARGRFKMAEIPADAVLLERYDKVIEKTRGTTAEPFNLFYRANTLFRMNRFDEAIEVFEDIKKRFPDHGLCRPLVDGAPSQVDDALNDCREEKSIRANYKVTELPKAVLDPTTRAVFHTTMGDFEIAFYKNAAPKTVANFIKLVKRGFYNNTYIHRVISLRRFEMGCPNTKAPNSDRSDDGNGSPGWDLPFELNGALHTRGAVSMLSLPGSTRSHGSQFTVCVVDQPQLNNRQVVFGRIVSGFDVVQRISQSHCDDNNNPYEHIIVRGTEIKTGVTPPRPRDR